MGLSERAQIAVADALASIPATGADITCVFPDFGKLNIRAGELRGSRCSVGLVLKT
jgi:hypothetical protein